MDENIRLTTSEKHNRLPKVRKYIALPIAALVLTAGVCVFAAGSGGNEEIASADETVFTDVIEEAVTESSVTDASEEDVPAADIPTRTFFTAAAVSETDAETEVCTATLESGGTVITLSYNKDDTAAEVLNDAGIEYDEDDILSVPEDETIPDGSAITLQRVEYIENTVVKQYKHKTVYRDDDTMPEGEEEVICEGVNGQISIDTRIKLVDGVEEDSEVINKEIIKPAVNEVILRGTMKSDEGEADTEELMTETEDTAEEASAADAKETSEDVSEEAAGVDPNSVDRVSLFEIPEWLKLDENGVPTEYIATHTGKSCAYTAASDALMSTGKTVFQGYVAVDPKLIPYGSELYIIADDGSVYGYAIAADTGYSVRVGDIVVDLFMNEYDDCIQWGARNVTIYVLK